jgi:hypothetical protein
VFDVSPGAAPRHLLLFQTIANPSRLSPKLLVIGLARDLMNQFARSRFNPAAEFQLATDGL